MSEAKSRNLANSWHLLCRTMQVVIVLSGRSAVGNRHLLTLTLIETDSQSKGQLQGAFLQHGASTTAASGWHSHILPKFTWLARLHHMPAQKILLLRWRGQAWLARYSALAMEEAQGADFRALQPPKSTTLRILKVNTRFSLKTFRGAMALVNTKAVKQLRSNRQEWTQYYKFESHQALEVSGNLAAMQQDLASLRQPLWLRLRRDDFPSAPVGWRAAVPPGMTDQKHEDWKIGTWLRRLQI